MKAAIVPRYGPPDVVRLEDLPDPTPAPGEVLVRVRATTVASGDARIRGFDMPSMLYWIPARLALGVLRPRRRVLGTEFAGVVDAVGDGVTRFSPGDRVFGMASFSKPTGAHAELLTIATDGMIEPMPHGMTFEEAGCLCFGLHTADHFLLKAASVEPGDRVMIIGASGAVGCAAVQLAKYAGAQVTAVCSTRHIELMRSLGADAIIDYTTESYTDQGDDRGPYDIIFDTVGATSPAACRRVLAKHGRFIALVLDGRTMVQALWNALTRRMKVITGVASEAPERLAYFREMIEAGAYRSVIDQQFPLEQISDAHRVVDGGHKQGNVVITMDAGRSAESPGTQG